MAEDDGLPRALVLVIYPGSIFVSDCVRTHDMIFSFQDHNETPHIADHMECDRRTAASATLYLACKNKRLALVLAHASELTRETIGLSEAVAR